LDDYYEGIEGARRLMKELDHFLQRVTDNVGHAETLKASIELCIEGGQRVSLDKSYRSTGYRLAREAVK
jgi:hypothetical protein